jgi:thioredoxin-like negative regulator of GroEL
MNFLDTQEQFEEMWVQGTYNKEPIEQWIVYFTASWCKPCQALDCTQIASIAKEKGIKVFKCDFTRNEYTPGFCNVNSFPTFIWFTRKQILSTFKSNQTAEVVDWIDRLA